MSDCEHAKHRLEAILNSSGDAIIFTYPDGRIRQVNPSFDRLFAYEVSDMVYRLPITVLAENDYQDALMEVLHRLREGTERLTLRSRRQDGSTFEADWVISAIRDDHETGFVCLVRDVSEDRRVKKSLKSTKEYLRLLINAAPLVLQIIAPNGEIILSEGELESNLMPNVGQLAFDWYPSDIIANIKSAMRGEMIREVHRMNERFLECIFMPTWGEDGQLEHVILVQVDISNHKYNELRYSALFEQTNDAIFLLNLYGKHVNVNQRAADMLGYTPDEMIGLSFRDVVMPVYHDQSQNILERLLSGEKIPHYERVFRHKDGTPIDVELNVELVSDLNGKPLHIQSLARDITERKRQEQVLIQSEQRYREMFENNRAVQLIISPHTGAIIDANSAATEFYGYSRDQLLSMKITDINTLPVAEVQAEMQRAAKEERCFFEFRHRVASGDIRDVEVFSGPVHIDGEKMLYSIVTDVTELRKARHAQLQLEVEQEKLTIIRQFIQNSAHEFRTPLSIISTNLFLLRHDLTEENVERRAAKIEQQISGILRLIDTLSQIIRFEGLTRLATQQTDLIALLQKAYRSAQDNHPDRKLHLQETYPPQLFWRASPEDLLLAFSEIFDNAFRFTPAGGMLQIYVKASAEDVLIEIADTGQGIAPDLLPKVFEKLFRGDEAHSTRGFGLGLAIVKRIIELHQGELELISHLGQGTVIRIILPK